MSLQIQFVIPQCFATNETVHVVQIDVKEKRKVWGIRYEATSCGRSSPGSLAFELAKRPNDRADYCLGCSILPKCDHLELVFTV